MDWNALLREEMADAVREKKRSRRDEEFIMRVRIVGPNDEIVETPIRWGNHDAKHVMLEALSNACRQVQAQAVTINSDSRFLNIPEFCRHFNVPPPPNVASREEYEKSEFERARLRILREHGGNIGNLPHGTFRDALMVSIKGPQVNLTALKHYELVVDRLDFEPTTYLEGKQTTILMMPAWWEEEELPNGA